jgi:hypothetical protein
MRVLYAVTVLLSALLLFLVQPIVAKALLPSFGGSAGVWTASMLFFQLLLLAGYAYAHAIAAARWRKVHVAILATSLLMLPLALPSNSGSGDPALQILWTLVLAVGLPYFALAATSPLLQAWYPGDLPYWLYSVSNVGSLLALLLYPFAMEPTIPLRTQITVWSVAFAADAVLLGILALRAPLLDRAVEEKPTGSQKLSWIALSACGSGLWMAVANHLSQDVAAVPFLWTLPLGLYLLSFVLTFESDRWYRPKLFRWLMPLAWASIGGGFALAGSGDGHLIWLIAMFCGALFVCCLFCHGELAASKPPVSQLTQFYLMLAVGGACGGLFVGLVAPHVFNEMLELPILLIFNFVLSFGFLYKTSRQRMQRLAFTACAGILVALVTAIPTEFRGRNFYGALQVLTKGPVKQLYHGTTQHGCQFTTPERQRDVTAYYSHDSGAGRALRLQLWTPAKVGIVGLGAGTLAAYAREGDEYRFYEINPMIVDVARRHFTFLGSREVVLGDARLSIQKDASRFHVLLIDAFSGDSIPVHLLTREAFAVWKEHLASDGILGIHVTNRFLDLVPVVRSAARELGMQAIWIHNDRDQDQYIYAADWVLMTSNVEAIRRLKPQEYSAQPPRFARLWTDDYSSLLDVLK